MSINGQYIMYKSIIVLYIQNSFPLKTEVIMTVHIPFYRTRRMHIDKNRHMDPPLDPYFL